MFGSLDRVECKMMLVILQFFEFYPNQSNVMEGDVIEVGSDNREFIV